MAVRLHNLARSFARACVVAVALTCVPALPGAHAQQAPTILVFGDSLSAAYGLKLEQGWVALLQARLDEQGYAHRIVNASISGETTAGGLRRLPAALEAHAPAVLILELGANDGLRGQPLKAMRNNLNSMLTQAKATGAQSLVLGMHIPANYGPRYGQAFHNSFQTVAEANQAALVPFFLEPIALSTDWFLDDGIHPNAAAQPLLLDHIWSQLQPLLDASAAHAAARASDTTDRPNISP